MSDYQQTLDFLFAQIPMYQQVGGSAYKPGLGNAQALDRYFGKPHEHYHTIHVAGTNGKGSVSHAIASVLQCAGYKTALYTSPHFKDFRERIKINGKMIPEEEVTAFVVKHRNIIESLKPSFFEMSTAMAFDFFARRKVDIAVIEVGLGGRFDSTNVIRPLLSVITNIGLDHVEFLGDTLVSIAGEKAGVIKPEIPVVVGEWDAQTAPIFLRKAAEQKAPLLFADQHYRLLRAWEKEAMQYFEIQEEGNICSREVAMDLLGNYQQKNILTIIAALDRLRNKLNFSDDAVKTGIATICKNTGLHGRWETIAWNPLVICDMAHNAHGMAPVMEQLNRLKMQRPEAALHIVMGVVSDKDIQHIFPLMPRDARYYFTQAAIPRAMDAAVLAEHAGVFGLKGEIISSVKQALKAAKNNASLDDIIFVGGSAFVVAEVIDF